MNAESSERLVAGKFSVALYVEQKDIILTSATPFLFLISPLGTPSFGPLRFLLDPRGGTVFSDLWRLGPTLICWMSG